MGKIELKNSYYCYKMTVDEDGHLKHNYFLPVEYLKDSRTEVLENRYCPIPFETMVDVNHEGFSMPHGKCSVYTLCSQRSVVSNFEKIDIESGTEYIITLSDNNTGLLQHLHYQVYENSPAIRRYTVMENSGASDICINHASTFLLGNFPYFNDDDSSLFLHTFRSSWCQEGNHYASSFRESEVFSNAAHTANIIESPGTWVCQDYIPCFAIEQQRAGICTVFQIEVSSAWRFEVGNQDTACPNMFYAQGGIGSRLRSGWETVLRPGEIMKLPAVSITVAAGDCEKALNYMHLHQSRVLIKRSLGDAELPVIYNDWMYITGNNTEETILKQLDTLKEIGAEVCVTDAGWFCENTGGERSVIWHMTGHYDYDRQRFPHGIEYVADKIREHGMKPGIWCEIECVGKCSKWYSDKEMLLTVGEDFVTDGGHRFLNFTNPKVIAYADEIFERFVKWGFEYIKIDYNSDSAPGADNCGSFNSAQGLYNNRCAYDKWLSDFRKRHPEVIIESCSSGGMRLEYNSLSNADMASITDQNDFRVLGGMLYNVTKTIHPSQCGNWAYTENVASDTEFTFALTDTMLGRMHLSGNFADLTPERKTLLKDAVELYKHYRHIMNDCTVLHHSGYYYTYRNNEKILCFELRATDNAEAVILAQRAECEADSLCVRLDNLEPGEYRAETFPKSEEHTFTSSELATGYTLKLPEHYTSQVVYIYKII